MSLTYEKATPTILSLYYVFIKKRKKNPEYYPGIFSYYICSSFSSICKPPFKTMIIVLSFITLMYSTKRLTIVSLYSVKSALSSVCA